MFKIKIKKRDGPPPLREGLFGYNVLSAAQIADINRTMNVKGEQGIYKEPAGIPIGVNEVVVYSRWHSAGRPGSCWDDAETINEDWDEPAPNDHFIILNRIAEALGKNLTPLQFNELKSMAQSNEETENGYYGDYSTYTTEYIILDHVYRQIALMD